ncbi:DUF3726 domain-containing protein [Pseudomonas sp. JS3066]|jgi:hypothetical protein|uniref:DUF3726 domain-containing protein n=1 Tax=unclassified Pseudomonas TaxID=196821 RepID=UPI00129D2B1C|nr:MULTISPECIES: DUF3726 domain-containing protein [unclassified Pseudomonas]MDH4654746.1 DUF3726 domain-containing protein [Pseudomonas sp. BN606]MRK23869.1 DUF3726 domain-containing protein [Pseudomonas sp. JG-B]WVK96013.1 DUF3726 domain-containing protein [Pseudomonas sp. JS3066]
MLISANELTSLLKRVFEGMGYTPGHYEDAAALVGWLQLHGEDGLGELERALELVADRDRAATELVTDEPGSLNADCHGRSALNCLPALLELACVQAVEQPAFRVEVQNCHNRKFVLKLLADCAQRGLWAQASWDNGHSPVQRHLAWIEAGASHPSYLTCTLSEHSPQATRQSLSLMLGTAAQPQPVGEVVAKRSERFVSPDNFALAREQALENGMEISPALWQRLNSLAEAVLVESSERSRGGAGGR